MKQLSALDEPVRSIAAHDPAMATGSDTLRMVAQKMLDADCSALLVERRTGELAIVTERDVVHALATGADPDSEWATDVMTREVLDVAPDSSIADVAELMQQARIRHVLVRSDAGALAIVSIRDLLDVILTAAD
ncbi:MAG: CBS domain-containing protein [Acidimicrobiia bacterium]|nr:CBS domain-containing protein [Acidimicrobiia bacterium]